jgi:uncharacterized protein YdeI (YjbR/CyaY-like superfamily)
MNVTKTLYVTSRKAWRQWLSKHYKTEPEIWLVYYRQQTGKPRIPYNDAVEEALCFGWIDSTVKSLDQERFAQRFLPRKPKSKYSQANQARLRKLVARGKVRKEVLATLGEMLLGKFEIPPDILKTLKANPPAWKNFRKFSEAYQRIRIAYIDGARNRPAEFKKRLKYFIKMTEQNKQFGFGIKDYY